VASAACASRPATTGSRQTPVFGELGVGTLELAETVWRLYSERTDAVAVVTA